MSKKLISGFPVCNSLVHSSFPNKITKTKKREVKEIITLSTTHEDSDHRQTIRLRTENLKTFRPQVDKVTPQFIENHTTRYILLLVNVPHCPIFFRLFFYFVFFFMEVEGISGQAFLRSLCWNCAVSHGYGLSVATTQL